ncbi:MAG: hypothetical protein IKV18_01175, partial [Alistipes sp.]|nr:hypothetical protein [Alistipes sp.]
GKIQNLEFKIQNYCLCFAFVLRLPRRYAPRNDTNECNTPKVDSPEIICSYIRFDMCSAPIL